MRAENYFSNKIFQTIIYANKLLGFKFSAISLKNKINEKKNLPSFSVIDNNSLLVSTLSRIEISVANPVQGS